MLKKEIEALIGNIDDLTFKEALKMTEYDIKFNRINFKIKTKIEDFVIILINSIRLLRNRY